nr:PRC-barrel domain-containing protein [uncultured Celeribacter sp.]
MKTLTKTLLSSATVLALMGTSAMADVTTSTEMSTDGVTMDTQAEAEMPTLEETGDAIADTASDAADATGDALEATGDAISNTATDVANALSTFGDETVSEIVGTKVVSVEGNDVGEIDAIVKDGGTLKAVVGIGGFLGIAEHDVLIDVNEFSMLDEDSVVVEGYTEAELKAMPDVDQSELTKVEGDITLEQAMRS